jgi:hypothetical protein
VFDVTIAGDINVDLILYGLNEFIPVEREVLATDFRLTLGGSAAIFAHNLSILGSKVGFIGMTGKDEMGAVALDRLRSAGVDTSRSVQAKDGTQTGVPSYCLMERAVTYSHIRARSRNSPSMISTWTILPVRPTSTSLPSSSSSASVPNFRRSAGD